MKDVFESLPKKTFNKVSLFEFIQGVKNNSRTSLILQMVARKPMNLSVIPEETVEEVLKRMEENAESLIT